MTVCKSCRRQQEVAVNSEVQSEIERNMQNSALYLLKRGNTGGPNVAKFVIKVEDMAKKKTITVESLEAKSKISDLLKIIDFNQETQGLYHKKS